MQRSKDQDRKLHDTSNANDPKVVVHASTRNADESAFSAKEVNAMQHDKVMPNVEVHVHEVCRHQSRGGGDEIVQVQVVDRVAPISSFPPNPLCKFSPVT